VLLMLSGLLVTHLRAVDRVGRFDGDVFMMILQDTSSAQAIFALQRVRDGMRASTWHDNELPDPAPLTITMTVAQYMESETAERLVQRAEKALQACRATGRNQIVIAEDIDSSRDI
jgi:diguanylate cyclase (GGDEF)-like protein